jgi:hypothetical protein
MSTLLANAAICAAFVTAFLGLVSYFVRCFREAKSTEKAILAEIYRLRHVVKRHIEIWKTPNTAAAHPPLIPFSHAVYDEEVKNVGRIRRKLVAHVVQFYGEIGFLNELQEHYGEYEAAGRSKEFEQIYLDSLKNLLHDSRKPFRREIAHANIGPKLIKPARLYARFIRAWIGDGIRKWKKPIITKS